MRIPNIGLVIHGGAGTIERSKMTPEREREYRGGLERALAAGYEILKKADRVWTPRKLPCACWKMIPISMLVAAQSLRALDQ
jgi:hypothetical protein